MTGLPRSVVAGEAKQSNGLSELLWIVTSPTASCNDERVLLVIRKRTPVNTFLGGTSHHLTKKALQGAGLSFKNITVSLIS